MSARRRRFGVSLPEDVVELLDRVAAALGTTRSGVVEMAIRSFLEEHEHYTREHNCYGLIVVRSGDDGEARNSFLEEFRDIVVSSTHYHVGSGCVEVMLVRGPSRRVIELERALSLAGCTARFIPIPSHGERRRGGDGGCR